MSDEDEPAPSPSATVVARRASRAAKSMREESGCDEDTSSDEADKPKSRMPGKRSRCKDGGGKRSLCEHGRQRYYCKDCGGNGICEHGRQRHQCKECGGSDICKHGRQRRHCKDCGGKECGVWSYESTSIDGGSRRLLLWRV